MKETDIKSIIDKNMTLTMMLGYATATFHSLQKFIPEGCYPLCEQEKYDWFIKALENIIYRDIPPPPMP